jgi:hypothetical protein
VEEGVTPYAQSLVARQRTRAKFPYLIEIAHPDYEMPWRYANSDTDIDYGGHTYQSALFSLRPPDRDGGKIGNASLSISAVDQYWIEKIRAAQKPAALRFIAVIVYDGQDGTSITPEPLEENIFTLRKAGWNEVTITWEMIFDETQSYILNSETCNGATTPGCA